MRVHPILTTVVLAVVEACSRSPTASSLGAAQGLPADIARSDRSGAADGVVAARGERTHDVAIKNVERLMTGFGMRLARSPEDDNLTAIAEEHMRKAHIPLPANHRFIISKRMDGWAISVCDIESFLRADRPHCVGAYHIEHKGGRMRLLYIEPPV